VPLQALAIGAPGIFSAAVAKWRKLSKGAFATGTYNRVASVFNF